MSETTHTPGWKVSTIDPAHVDTGVGQMCIDCSKSGRTKRQDAQHAMLVAAAPELLQACKVAFVALAAPEWGEAQDQIRAAIQKAEGGR